ncbi:MAG TPA: hypothetical protein VL027_08230 [Spongiibacteraceae bacterium]|nr:hypothetical protein [Spongiibacteraceae bacterium]
MGYRHWLVATAFWGWATAATAALPIQGCDSVPGITPVCGLQAPEDMERLPGGGYLILSQYGGMTGGAGSLALFDAAADRAQPLYPQPGADGAADWGDADCPGAPGAALSPHGIHLAQRADGAWQLLVVNHGGREAVEFFELKAAGGDSRLVWRGCAVAPEGAFLNDVVALPGGGLLVTHMFDRDDPDGLANALSGRDSGHVFRWRPGQGFDVLPGSRAPFPNGIQIDTAGSAIYLNLYAAGEVRKLDLASGRTLASWAVPSPDNSSWSEAGLLLVASHTGVFDNLQQCESVGAGACDLAYQIVAIDPRTLAHRTLFSHEGAPMGAGTVAVDLNGVFYIGSFAGDRLVKVRLD